MVELTLPLRTRLKSARIAARVTQQQAALALGLKAQSNIQRMESTNDLEHAPRQHIRNEQMSKLASLYECTEEYLVTGANPSSEQSNRIAPSDPHSTDNLEFSGDADEFKPNAVLLTSYPRQFFNELSGATELKLTGLNLRRIDFKYIPDLKAILDRQGKIKVLLLRPGCKACRYAAIQDRGSKANTKTYIATIREMLAELCKLKRGSNRSRIEIRTIDYALTFGLDMIDAEANNALIYVRYYPLYSQRTHDDQPIMRLRPSNEPWFSLYKKQFDLHWDMAKNWQCSHHQRTWVGKKKPPR